MWSTDRQIAAGDTVVVWLTRDQIQPLVVTPGKDFNTKFGNFKQSDFIGVPYGSKVVPKSGRGFIYILRPTPELWTLALPHRTQILYLADIAFITSYLGIKKGSKVIEAGTGSASFSHSVARTIGSTGHLWSYEFHEARFIKAKEEFTRHLMDDRVTIQHRNVCKEGFSVVDQVDSVFLDLPAPWDAVEHAKKALRKDCNTRICCFSPCIEQVLRTVSKLNEAGFTEAHADRSHHRSDITTYETLLRPIEVFSPPALQPVSVVSEKLKASEKKREEKRLKQIKANREKQMEKKRRREEEGGAGGAGGGGGEEVNGTTTSADQDGREAIEDAGPSKKRTRTTGDREVGEKEMDISDDLPSAPTALAISLSDAELDFGPSLPLSPETTTSPPPTLPISAEANTTLAPPHTTNVHIRAEAKFDVAKALPEVRGHTSYLTFACLIPISSSVPFSSGSTSSAASGGASDEMRTDFGTLPAPSDPAEDGNAIDEAPRSEVKR